MQANQKNLNYVHIERPIFIVNDTISYRIAPMTTLLFSPTTFKAVKSKTSSGMPGSGFSLTNPLSAITIDHVNVSTSQQIPIQSYWLSYLYISGHQHIQDSQEERRCLAWETDTLMEAQKDFPRKMEPVNQKVFPTSCWVLRIIFRRTSHDFAPR